jgi:hypothetical protein
MGNVGASAILLTSLFIVVVMVHIAAMRVGFATIPAGLIARPDRGGCAHQPVPYVSRTQLVPIQLILIRVAIRAGGVAAATIDLSAFLARGRVFLTSAIVQHIRSIAGVNAGVHAAMTVSSCAIMDKESVE